MSIGDESVLCVESNEERSYWRMLSVLTFLLAVVCLVAACFIHNNFTFDLHDLSHSV